MAVTLPVEILGEALSYGWRRRRVQHRFRLVEDGSKYGTETHEYLKDGRWRIVPPDIVQRKKTPDGRPVLFISRHTSQELCLIVG
jgi:hypothetical protein